MHEHHFNTDQPEQHDIFHNLLFQMLVDHGVTAVFYNDDLPRVFPDIGKGGGQNFGPLHVGEIIHLINSCSPH